MLKVRIVVSKVSRQLLQACTSSGQLSDPSRKLLTATKSKPCTDKPEARASALKRSTNSRSAALVTVALKQLGLADLKICLPITKKKEPSRRWPLHCSLTRPSSSGFPIAVTLWLWACGRPPLIARAHSSGSIKDQRMQRGGMDLMVRMTLILW